ncbi:DUF5085 domain-containing protein [Terribacillus saccharophilus]|uniref:DUF5085 family protein n=1 Tax=Terribacillus saccharophilus TaxID=361277 RepID=UPI000BA708BE|nr:DUF5085 family protein [Terribacillus saccharophilus]PAF16661.1 DUF5085 domain-containing protein [Terribacillus saccharophilus]PAF39384.1 DUF5085 domain-containing protein [Terribacillus saccharophilus]
MITNHKFAYRNVASKYYEFRPQDIDKAMDDFRQILEGRGLHLSGNMFFSILSDPQSEIMIAEIFLSVEEDSIKGLVSPEEEIRFRSYFTLSPMVMTRIMKDFDLESQKKYWELVSYLQVNHLEQATPVFIEFKNSLSGIDYVEMSIGYSINGDNYNFS